MDRKQKVNDSCIRCIRSVLAEFWIVSCLAVNRIWSTGCIGRITSDGTVVRFVCGFVYAVVLWFILHNMGCKIYIFFIDFAVYTACAGTLSTLLLFGFRKSGAENCRINRFYCWCFGNLFSCIRNLGDRIWARINLCLQNSPPIGEYYSRTCTIQRNLRIDVEKLVEKYFIAFLEHCPQKPSCKTNDDKAAAVVPLAVELMAQDPEKMGSLFFFALQVVFERTSEESGK